MKTSEGIFTIIIVVWGSDHGRYVLAGSAVEICSATPQIDGKALCIDHQPIRQLEVILTPFIGLHAAQGPVQGRLVLAAELDVLSVAPSLEIVLVLLWSKPNPRFSSASGHVFK